MAIDLLFKGCLAVVLATLCTNLCGCGEEVEVEVNYVCIDGSTKQEFCKQWRQSGYIKEDGKACFSEDAIVVTRKGHQKIGNIQVGDELLGMDHSNGQLVFSKVRAWLHRKVDVVSEMTVIETDAGAVITSPKHSLGIGDAREGKYLFAEELDIGHFLIIANGSAKIRRIRKQNVRGHYSPLTEISNFFVGTSEHSFVLAHSFAHLREPRKYEPLVHGAMSVAELFSSQLHEVDPTSDGYLHPVLRQLLHFAPFAKISPFVDGDGTLVEWTRNLTFGDEKETGLTLIRRLKGGGGGGAAAAGAAGARQNLIMQMMKVHSVSPQFLLNDITPALLTR